MHWCVYATPDFEGGYAWREGLALLGHTSEQRSLWNSRAGCFERQFDAVLLYGLQGNGRAVRAEYQDRDVPVLVADYGYMRRVNNAHNFKTGHWQVGIGGLNSLPRGPVDGSRFDALNIRLHERGGDPSGYVLLTVQTPLDASHGLDTDGLRAWCMAQQKRWPDLLIRPHPQEPDRDYGLPRCEAETLEEALSGARLVVTGNSNTGHEALLAGVPVVATLPGATWDGLSSETLPSLNVRRDYFNRCAWGQWTWEEMRQGLPQRMMIEQEIEHARKADLV